MPITREERVALAPAGRRTGRGAPRGRFVGQQEYASHHGAHHRAAAIQLRRTARRLGAGGTARVLVLVGIDGGVVACGIGTCTPVHSVVEAARRSLPDATVQGEANGHRMGVWLLPTAQRTGSRITFMASTTAFAETAALVGDPARANMLTALMDGRALTAAELARAASVAPQTAGGHLGRLTAAGLLAVERQGRYRYHRIASPAVARMLEGIMAGG